MSSNDRDGYSMESWEVTEMDGRSTHHKCLEVRTPPLGEAVTNLPFIVDAMRRVELPRVRWRREPVIQTLLQSLNLIFSGLQVVTRPAQEQARESRALMSLGIHV